MTAATASPSVCYRVGYMAGAVVRGLLTSLRHSTAEQPYQAPSRTKTLQPQVTLLQAQPSQDFYSALERAPAIVRCQAVDLKTWYASNVRVKPKRGRKPKAAATPSTTELIDQVSPPDLGSLDPLIAPVEAPYDWKNAPHWMDNLNTDHWTEADWDRLSR